MKATRKLAVAAIALALALPLSAQEGAPKMTAEQQAMMEVWQKISTPGMDQPQPDRRSDVPQGDFLRGVSRD